MTDERHSERPEERQGERQAERDSQLSAMFDGELPAAECELLARRLSRDEALRAQWSRFSMIGAALRAERGVALHDRVAWRVQSVIAQETTYGDNSADTATRSSAVLPASGQAPAARRWTRFARPVAGASIAAGVAAVSILWLRDMQGPEEVLQASVVPAQSIVLTPEASDTSAGAASGTTVALNSAVPEQPQSNGEPERYSTPAPSTSTSIAPPARLANYVVAHSEYSGPLTRRMALLGIVGAESGEAAPEADAAPATDGNDAN
jgi:sigma-E factor negative regulatory protein RseA